MNNDQHESFDTGDLDADAGLEDFETGTKVTFADAWKTNPLVKIGVVVAGLAVLVGGIMIFGGNNKPVAPSVLTGTTQTNLKEAPGGKVPELYAKAVTETNEADAEKAINSGSSTIPVPLGPARGKVEVDANKEGAEDPLERWRRIQEERTKKEQQSKVEPAAAPPPAPVDPYAQQKQQLSQSMQTQMTSILESLTLKEPKHQDITTEDWLKNQAKGEESDRKAKADVAAASAAAAPTPPLEILLEPGRIEYAQLIIEANSDIPGPVLAELASGPLIGDRLIGGFTKQDDFLVLKFDTVVVDGVGLTANAIALDPETSRPGVVTDVDHKYFTRVILPAASAFISGIGSAIGDSGSTTVSAGAGTATTAQNPLNTKQEFFKGIAKASDKLSEVLNQDATNTQPRVRVAAGTHIGVLFTKAVTKAPPGGPQVAATAPVPPPAAQQILLQLQPASQQGPLQQAVQAQAQPTPAAGTPVPPAVPPTSTK